jgi:hypothetical protein
MNTLIGPNSLESVGGVVLLIVLLSGSGKVTRANYEKLRNGMTESEVRDLLGAPTDSREFGPIRVFIWRSGDTVITVHLHDGQVRGFQGFFGGAPPDGMHGPGGPRFP